MEHHRRLERMYLNAAVNRVHYSGITLGVESGKAVLSLVVGDDWHHALGAMHGAVYFKMLDDAAFFAVQSEVYDCFILTTSFHVQLFRPFERGLILAEGQLTFSSRLLFHAESVLRDEKGRVLARGAGSFAKSKKPLAEAKGY